MMLPPNIDVLIPEKHLVQVINQVVEKMAIEAIIRLFKGGGTINYHSTLSP